MIGEVKHLIPNKPIRYLVSMDHTNFDQSGGIRTYGAEGATMVTQEAIKVFWEQTLKLPHTIHLDKLADLKTTSLVEGVSKKRIITDGTRRLEFYDCQSNAHYDAPLIVHLVKKC